MINYTTATNGKITKTFKNLPSTRSSMNILKFLSVFALVMLGVNGVMGQSISMTATGSNTQSFGALPTTSSVTWSDNSTISAWYTSNGGSVIANTGASNTAGQLYSYGTGTNADRALGSINSNATGGIAYGVQLQNNSASTITTMTVAYTGEQWRKENNATSDQILFYYRVYSSVQSTIDNSATGWTPVTSLNFTAPIAGATTASALDGNATANRVVFSATSISSLSIPAGSFVVFKWIDQNISGNDHGIGIDDVTINWTATAASTPPTLTAAGSATVDAAFNVTFPDDPTWRAAITSITVGGTTLTAGSAVTAGQIAFTPSASAPASLLQSSGSKSIVVIATGYTNASVTQSIGVGAATKLGITTQPTAPASNGGALAAQPVVAIQDQYNNTTTSTAAVAAAVGAGAWTLGGTTSVAAVSGTTTYSGLTATSAASVTGATITFTSAGLTGVTSGAFNIPSPPPANDICSNATTLTVGASATSGTNVLATKSSPSTFTALANYNSTSPNPDVWYSFTPSCSGNHTITVTPASIDIVMAVFEGGSCPNPTYITYKDDNAGGAAESYTFVATQGTTYRVMVFGWSGATGSFTIGVTTPTLAVTTNAASSINTTVATLNGNTTTLCPNITEIGFVYSLTSANSNPIVAGTGVTKVSVTSVEGNFTSTLTGLTTGVGYSYKAYAYDGTTYTYGSVQTFTPNIPPVVIYQHNFGTTAITSKPYTAAPGTFASNLSNSSWTASGSFIDIGGSSGKAIGFSAVSSGPYTLTFNVASGYQLSVSSYSYWRQTSASGSVSSITINGTAITSGALAAPTSGSDIGTTNVANTISGLTGTITVVINLTGTGSFRVDDFTLIGNVVCLPATASVLSTTTPAICNGGAAGNIRVNITGGTSPFSVVYNDGTGNTTQSSYTSGSNISLTPSSPTTYTLVSVTDANSCVSTGLSGTATITPVSGAANTTLAGSNAAPVEQCTDGAGWTYYATSAAPTQLLFAIKKNGNTINAAVDLTVNTGSAAYTSTSSNGANQEHGSYLLGRYWNVNCTGCTYSLGGGVDVRFFYDPTEITNARSSRNSAFSALKSANTSSLADTTASLEWFKTNSVVFTPSNFTGNRLTVAHTKLTGTLGTLNSVNYVEFTGISSFSGGGGGFGFGPPSGGGGVGLPVNWAGFDASVQREYTELIWHTASEQNTSHFEVEASEDGKTFKTISDNIAAAGNSASLLTYSFRDIDMAHVKYYRLKQVDIEGTFEYSKIIIAKRSEGEKQEFDIVVYPVSENNNRQYHLLLKNKIEDISTIQIVDYTGKPVFHMTSSKNAELLDLNFLTPGIYMIQIWNGEGKQVERVVVQ